MNTLEFLINDHWTAFTARSGMPIRFADQKSAKAMGKYLAVTDDGYPTNFLHWRVVDTQDNKYSIL